jgi:phosphoglycerate dehydrogenase-like enzyme
MGGGTIGSQTRLLLEAFACHVKTFARSSSADINTLPELDKELAQADIVIASLPHTPLTDTLLDAQRLAKFKQGAIFVNVGRGTLVDELALIAGLQSGAIGGAVLDVTRQEPLLADHPLWQTPNTILLQHSGGGYDREIVDKTRFFLENLERYRSDKPLINIVDFERGY